MAKRMHVPVSKDENLVVLRCYVQNPSNWPAVVEEVRANVHLLPNSAKQIYKVGSTWKWDKVRRRMADQVAKYCTIDLQKVQDEELRALVDEVRKIRGKYAEKATPEKRRADNAAEKDNQKKRKIEASDRLQFIPELRTCGESSENESAPCNVSATQGFDPDQEVVPGPSSKSKKNDPENHRKTSAQLAREANEMYIDFTRNRLPTLTSKMEKCMDKYLNQ